LGLNLMTSAPPARRAPARPNDATPALHADNISDPAGNASIAGLVHQLIEDGGQLVRAELRLAQAEVGSTVHAAMAPLAAIAVGGVFLLASILTLLAAIVGWLTPWLGAGNAAMAVTLGAIAIGGALVMIGVGRLKAVRLVPPRLSEINAPSPD
jgi:hypothetical protein